MESEVPRIFMYIAAFGISDLFVRHYIHSPMRRVFYYLLIGIVGYRLAV
jgi:hypothetical protein